MHTLEPDFDGANLYAINRLARDLPPNLYYHNLSHTRDDILPAALRLARYEGVSRSSCALLMTACYYHDIGFIISPVDHEATSARMVGQVLPEFGFTPRQIAIIQGCILVTHVFTPPKSLLEAIIVDADLDVLGRSDFLPRGFDLRREQVAQGRRVSDEQWFRSQLNFLTIHQYRTISAQSLRNAQKRENMRELSHLLGQFAPFHE